MLNIKTPIFEIIAKSTLILLSVYSSIYIGYPIYASPFIVGYFSLNFFIILTIISSFSLSSILPIFFNIFLPPKTYLLVSIFFYNFLQIIYNIIYQIFCLLLSIFFFNFIFFIILLIVLIIQYSLII